MTVNNVRYYQDRDDGSTLVKSVESGENAGLYLWQIGPKKWKKLDGEAYEIINHMVMDYANTRVISEEQMENEIARFSEQKYEDASNLL